MSDGHLRRMGELFGLEFNPMKEGHFMNPTSRPEVVLIDVAAHPIAEATALVGTALFSAVEQKVPFAAVVVMPESTGPRGRRFSQIGERVRMLKRLRPGLRQWCRGLAFVASAQMQADNHKALRAGAKMWGCATFAATDVASARSWARAQLNAAD